MLRSTVIYLLTQIFKKKKTGLGPVFFLFWKSWTGLGLGLGLGLRPWKAKNRTGPDFKTLDIVGAKMDSISDLIGALLRYCKRHPKTTLILFKSDVSAAYRRLPLHPLWQVKQIVIIDGIRHVDRCTCFGGRGSCRDYTALMSSEHP